MRPRDRILLIDRNLDRRGITRFVLDNWRYNVTVVNDEIEAAAVLATQETDENRIRVIIAYPTVQERLVSEIAYKHHVPSLMIRVKDKDLAGWCDRTLFRPPMSEIVEAVRIMAQRKRGSRKGTTRKPVGIVACMMTGKVAAA